MSTTDRENKRTVPQVERRPSFIGREVNQPVESSLSFFRNRDGNVHCEGSFETYIPPLPYEVSGAGKATYKYKALQFYKELLCEWCYAIPYSSQWVVFIEPYNQEYLTSQLVNMKEYEPWTIKDDWNTGEYVKSLTNADAQEVIGCIFCIGISEAGVRVGVETHGGVNGNNVGYTKLPISTNREDHESLETVFRESNCSYSQYVINPWIRLVGHKGLHNRPQSENIKAKITVFHMGQTGGANVVRKAVVYHDCAPTSLNDEHLDQDGQKLVQRQVTWTYNYLTLLDMTDFENLDEDFVNERDRT